jgi:hypothetical protein
MAGGYARLPEAAMLISSFDEREVEILLLALRYWRSRRTDGHTRRTDPPVTPDAINVLMAKLGCGSLSSLPPDDLTVNSYRR